MKRLSQEAIELLVRPIAAQYEVVPEHWVGRGDEGLSFCKECCEAEVDRLLKEDPDSGVMVDGGWVMESDGFAFCETCGKALDVSFTTYACESELDRFEAYGFDLSSASDCWSMERILSSVGFLDEELTPRIKRVVGETIRNCKLQVDARPD